MNIFLCQVSVKTFGVFLVRMDEHLSVSSAGENILYIPGSEWMNIFLCQVSVKTFGVLLVRLDEHLSMSRSVKTFGYSDA